MVFLDPDNGLFRVGCIYGRNDDANRFAFFNGIATEYIARSGMNPDIVHCHDWQTAPGVFNGGPGKKVNSPPVRSLQSWVVFHISNINLNL